MATNKTVVYEMTIEDYKTNNMTQKECGDEVRCC